MSYPYDPMDDEHRLFRAHCEQLAADYLAVVDVRDVVDVDELEQENAVLEDGRAVPAA